MPKKVKSSSSKTSTKKKVVKKTKKSKTKPVVVETTPVVETAPVVETTPTVVETTESATDSLFNLLVTQSKEISKAQKEVTASLKRVYKLHLKECKELKKKSSSRKRSRDPNKPKRAPSGFAKPTQITNNLCDFLGVPHGQLVARTDVTKKVTAYIRDNNLQVKDNKRQFVPDKKLQSILGPLDSKKKGKDGKTDAEKGYTYFNLQKYLSDQFPKTVTA